MVNQIRSSAPSSRPRIIPDGYRLLAAWAYAEHSLMRILAGWGRQACDWEDKMAVSYHVWMQAEITLRMRKRLDMFPGGKADAPVHQIYEDVMNHVILAPTFRDAIAGVQEQINPALCRAYKAYMDTTHPVHDRPTVELLREVLALKSQQAEWYAGFCKRYPQSVHPEYAKKIEASLAEVGDFLRVIDATEPYARPCGRSVDFRLASRPGRRKEWEGKTDIMPLLNANWSRDVEARRLFFAIGYMWEMGVAESQLSWIYYADYMPFEYVHAEARHMWDEARHGDSGLSRMRDFGLDIEDVGYTSYGNFSEGYLDPMTPQDVYEAFFNVTQVAETGFFETKRYCFQDFAEGDDDASAEMMQYDIIDETSHVEYGREWLPLMMNKAGIEEDYRKRGLEIRVDCQAAANKRVAEYQAILDGTAKASAQPSQPVAEHTSQVYNPSSTGVAEALLSPVNQAQYEKLVQMLRAKKPLKNAGSAPLRPNLPM